MNQIIQSSVEGVCLSVYVVQIFFILSSSKSLYKSGFFLIFASTGCADVIGFFVNLFLRLLRLYKWQQWSTHLASFCVLLSGNMFLAHFFGHALITINRYTSICHAARHQRIWRPRNIKIFVFLQFLLSFSLLPHNIGVAMVWLDNKDGTFTYASLPRDVDIVNRFIYAFVCGLFCISSIVLNILTVTSKLARRSEAGSKAKKKTELNLIFFCLCTCCFCFLMCAMQVGKGIAQIAGDLATVQFLSLQFFWVNDLLMFCNPIFLLIFCRDLRSEIWGRLPCSSRKRREPIQTINVGGARASTHTSLSRV